MDRRRFLALGAATIGLWPLLRSGAAFAGGTSQSYGSGKLDLYPITGQSGESGAPILIYVHGGAWKAGSKSSVGAMPQYFNSLGTVFVSVGYSLGANVGQQASQIGEAVAWVAQNAAQLGGDPARIALMGHSAGCHLSCLAVLTGQAPAVRALVANDTAAYDLAFLADINNGRLPLLYASPFRDRSKWPQWSPISHAAGGNAIPVLVAWSGGRNRQKISQRFAAALEAGGHKVVRFDGSAYNHISISRAVGKPKDPLNRAVTQFLEEALAIVEPVAGPALVPAQ